jgi:exopolysaccharide production protein ExoZ
MDKQLIPSQALNLALPVKLLRPSAQKNEFIQLMRFVAAALVLVTHITFYFHERISTSLSIWHFGEIGVPIFFMISGIVMVISSASLASDMAGAKKFISRRLWRILPLYWTVTLAKVLMAVVLPSVVLHGHFEAMFALKSFLFIPAYNVEGDIRPIHGVGWTLLHEMYFYVVFSIMMLLRTRPALSVSVFIVVMYIWGQLMPAHDAIWSVLTDPINLYFVMGMLVGCSILNVLKPSLVVSVLVLISFAHLFVPASVPLPFDIYVPLLGCLMLWFSNRKLPGFLKVPVSLGESSYALYLFHPFLAPAVLILLYQKLPFLGVFGSIAMTVIVVVAASHAIHLWFESPLNRVMYRLFNRAAVSHPKNSNEAV